MHARTFLCREALWETFQDMARQEGAPVDDLLTEAMRSYARQRSYGGQTGEEPQPSGHNYAAAEDEPDLARTGAVRQSTQRLNAPTAEAPAMRRSPSAAPNARPMNVSTTRGVAPPHGGPPPRQPAPLPEVPRNIPLQRPFTQPLGHALPAPPSRAAGRGMASAGAPPPPPSRAMPSAPRSMPPPLPPSEPVMPAHAGYGGARGRVATQLSLTYMNRTVDVTKERFLLGRSKSQADLVLDDANVSRQHAAIERVGDLWFLADLGSTNGCYVEGQRVSRRQIADGDVIEITTHQIRCTLR